MPTLAESPLKSNCPVTGLLSSCVGPSPNSPSPQGNLQVTADNLHLLMARSPNAVYPQRLWCMTGLTVTLLNEQCVQLRSLDSGCGCSRRINPIYFIRCWKNLQRKSSTSTQQEVKEQVFHDSICIPQQSQLKGQSPLHSSPGVGECNHEGAFFLLAFIPPTQQQAGAHTGFEAPQSNQPLLLIQPHNFLQDPMETKCHMAVRPCCLSNLSSVCSRM